MQHWIARDVGLVAPDTFYSNDPAQIRQFIRDQGGTVMFKSLKAAVWTGSSNAFVLWTTPVHEDDLVDDDIMALSPAIFQAVVPKAFELRVTVLGRHVVAAKLHSQETTMGQLDWRRGQEELAMEPFEIPAPVVTACLAFMDKLGIVFGAFDFIVTPGNEYVFLEVNQAGQFLFLERRAGLPILDAFSDFLIEGRPDFEWSSVSDRMVHVTDVEATATAHMADVEEKHVRVPDGYYVE